MTRHSLLLPACVGLGLVGCGATPPRPFLEPRVETLEELTQRFQSFSLVDLGPIYGTRQLKPIEWTEAQPSQIQTALLDSAWDYAEARPGNLGLVVIHRGKLVFERYHQEPGKIRHWDATRTTHAFSATKTLAGLLVGVVSTLEGEATLLDRTVHQVLPELIAGREGEDLERAKRITVRHLLQLTSGLAVPLTGFPPNLDYFVKMVLPIDLHPAYDYPAWLMTGIKPKMQEEPGSNWRYFSGQLELVSALLGRLARKHGYHSVQAMAQELLFDKIGFTYSRWNEDGAGNPFFFAGMFTSTRGLAKLGQVYLAPPKDTLPDGWLATSRQGSETNPSYGLTLWLNRPQPYHYLGKRLITPCDPPWPSAPADTAVMMGFKNNNVYVIESLGLVVARSSDRQVELPDWQDDPFLQALLGQGQGEAWR